MNPREELRDYPIHAVYDQKTPNDPIDFGTTPVSILQTDSKVSDSQSCRAMLHFLPNPSLDFQIAEADTEIFACFERLLDNSTKTLQLTDYGKAFDAFVTSSNSTSTTYHPHQTPVQVRPHSDIVRKATFHLLNWPDFGGTDDFIFRTDSGGATSGRIFLKTDGWKITISCMQQTESIIKQLKQTNGFAITHVGSIQREDDSEFSTESLEAMLVCLRCFFSFALGQSTGPDLTVGFDSSEERVFEHWGIFSNEPGAWGPDFSWFDLRHAELLSEVLPGFHALWSNPIWSKPLKTSIYWYLRANKGGRGAGVDAALLLSQSALELLAWTYCVKDKQIASKKAFKTRGLSASEKLRLMASSLNLPLEIPQTLTALHSKTGTKWLDSMEAITAIRNGLVHPGETRTVPDGAYYDAWRLSLWYIELVILKLCGHNGQYANRIAERCVGQTETVPWKT
jgi:hypothetical protein